jgi:hypothetical protein
MVSMLHNSEPVMKQNILAAGAWWKKAVYLLAAKKQRNTKRGRDKIYVPRISPVQ